jgi:hypothetical protein
MTDQELLEHLQKTRIKYQDFIIDINKQIRVERLKLEVVERLKLEKEKEKLAVENLKNV